LVKFLNIALILVVIISNTNDKPDQKKIYSEIKSWYRDHKDKPVTFFNPEHIQMESESSVIQIILIRHGNPRIKKNGWYLYKDARNYIKAYDLVGVYQVDRPPVMVRSNEDIKIFSSPLNRAYNTAQKIFGDSYAITRDSSFIEFQREITPLPLILPINAWTGLSRFLWILGLHSSDIPSFPSEKLRAELAAVKLESSARDNNVILVGHGLLNRYIIKYLKKKGWEHSYNGGMDYLSVHVMTKIIAMDIQ
jgi:broad specificity phosphatase PhoE